jgi:flagellum-specific peptidoglycan hydrolase FlgJ
MLSDLLNGQGQTNNDPGMLGLALLQVSRNGGNLRSLLPLLAQIDARKNQEQPQAPSPVIPSMAQPSNGTDALPQDKSALLASLKQQAAAAYPDNPTLQQVAITQAIQESGLLGKNPSKLATENYNLFGIKEAGNAGSVNLGTTEYINGMSKSIHDDFGRNRSVGDSFLQQRDFLNKKRYSSVLSAQSPTAAFSALQQAGYATDPQYAKHLDRVYRQYVAPLYEI